MLKFSLIMPAYNNKKLLANTLLALNLQKGYSSKDYEVIVVDDGSPEKLLDFVQCIPVNYQFKYLYLERTPNSCRAAARNRGLAQARGEIVIFIDSDMLVDTNYLSEVDRCFQIDKNICLISTRLYADKPIETSEVQNQTVFTSYQFQKCRINCFEPRHVVFANATHNAALLKTPWLFVYSCNMAVLRKNLQAVGVFDENYKGWGYEDIDLAYRLHKYGLKIMINRKMEAIHQYHGETTLFFAWSVEKFQQNKYNEDYFFGKYREIEKIVPYFYKRNHFYTFKKLKLHYFVTKKSDATKKYHIELKEPEEVQRKLEDIAAGKEKCEVYLYDTLENTDLDIWIQLLDGDHCSIRYYPKSRQGKKMKLAIFSLLYMAFRTFFGAYLTCKERTAKAG